MELSEIAEKLGSQTVIAAETAPAVDRLSAPPSQRLEAALAIIDAAPADYYDRLTARIFGRFVGLAKYGFKQPKTSKFYRQALFILSQIQDVAEEYEKKKDPK